MKQCMVGSRSGIRSASVDRDLTLFNVWLGASPTLLLAMSSKRGRKRNDNLPPNRARDVQRAFRARRAAHLLVSSPSNLNFIYHYISIRLSSSAYSTSSSKMHVSERWSAGHQTIALPSARAPLAKTSQSPLIPLSTSSLPATPSPPHASPPLLVPALSLRLQSPLTSMSSTPTFGRTPSPCPTLTISQNPNLPTPSHPCLHPSRPSQSTRPTPTRILRPHPSLPHRATPFPICTSVPRQVTPTRMSVTSIPRMAVQASSCEGPSYGRTTLAPNIRTPTFPMLTQTCTLNPPIQPLPPPPHPLKIIIILSANPLTCHLIGDLLPHSFLFHMGCPTSLILPICRLCGSLSRIACTTVLSAKSTEWHMDPTAASIPCLKHFHLLIYIP